MMPQIAQGDANKVWVIPSEITKALEGLGSSIHEIAGIPQKSSGPRKRVDMGPTEPETPQSSGDAALAGAQEAVQAAIAEAASAEMGGRGGAKPAAAPETPPEPPAPPPAQ
jgi:hypothetical protein